MMKAAFINRYGSPGVFETGTVPKPVPGAHEVLIRVHASSVNPVDFKTRQGNLRFILGSRFPIILGYDAAGEVAQVGHKVRSFRPGDRVFTRLKNRYGQALAEYAVAGENILALIPGSLHYEQAAAFPLAALTALQALRDKGNIQEKSRVLIIGATGGVGHFAVQIAHIMKAHVTAYCGPGHHQILQMIQPEHIIRYNKYSLQQIDHTYDIVFDAAGKASFPQCSHLLPKGGVYISILPRPKLVVHKAVGLLTGRKKVRTLLMRSNKADMEWICSQINHGKLGAHIDRTFSLDDIDRAHLYAEQGHTEGKIVITIP